jgi:predicted component of type VI protein secretion system
VATLILLHGSTPDREIEIGERTLRVGRGDQNDVVLTDPGKSVSRFHAELRVEQGRFIIVDLNSQNGVWVGGRRVPQAVLEPGVPVVLGTYQLILKPERLAQPDTSDATVITGTPPLGPQVTEIAPVPAPVPLASPKAAASAKPAPSVRPPAPSRPAAQAKPAKQAQPSSRGVLKWSLIGGAAVLVLVAVIVGVMLAPIGGPRSEPAGAPPADAPVAPAPAPSSAVTPVETPAASPVELPPVTPPVTTLPVPSPPVTPPPVRPRPEPQPVARPAATPGATPGATPPRTQPAGRRGAAPPAPEAKPKGPNLTLAFEEARAALNRGDYPAAISGLESILSVDASYPKAADMLEVARGSARNAASTAVAAGGKAEAGRDWAEAERQYERALQADPQSTQAQDGLRRVKARMLSDGEDAFKRARQYDALGRVQEAIAMYERAIQLLPSDHASLTVARERLAALKGGMER